MNEENGTDEMRLRLTQYLQAKKGQLAKPTASTEISSKKSVPTAVRSVRSGHPPTRASNPTRASLKTKDPAVGIKRPNEPTKLAGEIKAKKPCSPANVISGVRVNDIRRRALNHKIVKHPDFCPRVISGGFEHLLEKSPEEVAFHREALVRLVQSLRPLVEDFESRVCILRRYHQQVTIEQKPIMQGIIEALFLPFSNFVDAEFSGLLNQQFEELAQQAQSILQSTNHLAEWKDLKKDIQSLIAGIRTMHRATDSQSNFLLLNAI